MIIVCDVNSSGGLSSLCEEEEEDLMDTLAMQMLRAVLHAGCKSSLVIMHSVVLFFIQLFFVVGCLARLIRLVE